MPVEKIPYVYPVQKKAKMKSTLNQIGEVSKKEEEDEVNGLDVKKPSKSMQLVFLTLQSLL